MNFAFGDSSGKRIKSLGVHKPEEIAQCERINGKLLDSWYRIHMCPWSLERNSVVCISQNKQQKI